MPESGDRKDGVKPVHPPACRTVKNALHRCTEMLGSCRISRSRSCTLISHSVQFVVARTAQSGFGRRGGRWHGEGA